MSSTSIVLSIFTQRTNNHLHFFFKFNCILVYRKRFTIDIKAHYYEYCSCEWSMSGNRSQTRGEQPARCGLECLISAPHLLSACVIICVQKLLKRITGRQVLCKSFKYDLISLTLIICILTRSLHFIKFDGFQNTWTKEELR